jgi:uroporphyrinogen-III decarboxylase
MKCQDDLDSLINKVQILSENSNPAPWGNLWDRSVEAGSVGMFSFPNPVAGKGLAPYVFAPDANFYARLFGYSLKDVFTDAYTWLCFSLRQMIWNRENLQDDGNVSKTILINQLGFFAPSLFGVDVIYTDDAVPWIGSPVIKSERDFANLKPPDFFSSGLSPIVHRMYDEAQELLPGDFQIEFTTWLTGPFSLLFHLRGADILAMDLIDNPKFVHEMMAFATECMREWIYARIDFLGRKDPEPLLIGDDEVGVPLIAPAHYEEFIFPYENALGKEFGIDYWHSCSNTTPLFGKLSELSNLRMMDVGPWTALQPAIDMFGHRPGSSLMKRLHPVSEVLLADEASMRERLLQIKATCYEIPYMLFFDGLNVLNNISETVRKIKMLDRVCHELFHLDAAKPDVHPEKVAVHPDAHVCGWA